MDVASGLNVVEARRLEQRGAATREVIQSLLVLLQREASHQYVRIGGAEAHGRERKDGEAHEDLDEGEAAASHLASIAGKGAQVSGSIGTMVRFSLRVMSRRTRSHVPSG